MVTQPGRAPPGAVSCPVEPASVAASMARMRGRDAARARPCAEGGETPRVLPAALAVLHGTKGGEVAGGNKNFFQQFLHRHAPGHPAQGRQTLVERLHPEGEVILRPALDGL